jgi:tetratricopeptide (TPR) repeat protein
VRAADVPWSQTEPVVALAGRFESELDLPLAAAELGLSAATLVNGLGRHPELAQRLGALKAQGGTIQRQVLVSAFADLVQAYRLGTHLPSLRQAFSAATEAIRRNPQNPSAYFERGTLHFEQADYEKAVDDFNEGVRLGLPGSAVYEYRGMALANRGEYDRAIEDYDRALAKNPGRAETYHNRGLAYAQKSELQKALADLDAALAHAPQDERVYSDRGYIHARRGDLTSAIADYNQSLQLQPNSPATLVRRGDAYQAQGKLAHALADYVRALQLNPHFGEAANKLGLARLLITIRLPL